MGISTASIIAGFYMASRKYRPFLPRRITFAMDAMLAVVGIQVIVVTCLLPEICETMLLGSSWYHYRAHLRSGPYRCCTSIRLTNSTFFMSVATSRGKKTLCVVQP